MDLIHDGSKLRVFLVLNVDRVPGVFKVLDVLRVHLEEVRELDHDVANLLVLGVQVPLVHPVTEL